MAVESAMNRLTLLAIVAFHCCGCSDRDLRGGTSASKDGKTYLVVVESNGPACGTLKVDGKVWPHAIGEAGSVAPGRHRIQCGAPDIEFDIPPGQVFKFDYWGP
jgi:hypothetical protein